MVVLKKIRASTLMETLVASVLIVVAFMLASMILNNLFSSNIKSNTRSIETHLNEMEYLYVNDKIVVPYNDVFGQWHISIEKYKEKDKQIVIIEAIHTDSKHLISRNFIAN